MLRSIAATTELGTDFGVQWETLAGAGAILVGVILTGLWADRRQRRALVAERDRLDLQLVAERERFEAQQAHDRELADLAELRSLLDKAAEELSELDVAAASVIVWRQTEDQEDRAEKVLEASKALMTPLSHVAGMTARIALRIGWGHELVNLHWTAMDDLRTSLAQHTSAAYPLNSDELATQEAALHKFKDDVMSFVTTARGFVASRLPVPE